MVAPLYIILILIFIAILSIINVYLLKLYCHRDDKGWKKYVYCKVLIVFGLTLCQAQALMVPLDVANAVALQSASLLELWTIVYIIILLMVSILLPYALFFYETDPDDSFLKRVCIAFFYTLGSIAISAMLLFITWTVFKKTSLPYKQVALNFNTNSFNRSVSNPKNVPEPTLSQKQFEYEASLAVYIMAILSFFGWIFVILFGGVGIFALPIDMINQFRHRPRPRKAQEMRKAKDSMITAIKQLIKQSENISDLDQSNTRNAEAGFLAKMKGNRRLSNDINRLKIKYYALEEQFNIFNLELKFSDTNPIIPFLKLVLGIIFTLTSILWMIQIIFGNIAKSYSNSSQPLIPFLNELLLGLQEVHAGFLSTFVFAYLCLYLLWSLQKGNIKFGIRIPFCCRFHPMIPNETWMNSFLFNVILLLIGSVGVIQLCVTCFPIYTRYTDIYTIFGSIVKYMTFYRFFYEKNAFTIAFVVWSFIALIYMLVTINKKPSYLKQIEKIRQEKEKVRRQAEQQMD